MSDARLPAISLVTPSLNQGRYIRATVESVLSQDYPALDYFVQDGGSTDGTLEILRSYEGRVAFVTEKDRGQADAINRGLRKARGEVLGYLNSDDVLAPGALRAVGEAFAAHPEILFVWGRATYVDAEGRRLTPYLVRPDALERLADACFVAQPAAFFRRKVREEVGEFDETLHHTMDYDYWLRAGSRYPAGVIPEYLANFRYHPDSKSGSVNRQQFRDELRLARAHGKGHPLALFLHAANYHKIVTAYAIPKALGR